jgi:hypothetical protein
VTIGFKIVEKEGKNLFGQLNRKRKGAGNDDVLSLMVKC